MLPLVGKSAEMLLTNVPTLRRVAAVEAILEPLRVREPADNRPHKRNAWTTQLSESPNPTSQADS
jgi:hypothetical protein